MSELGEPGLSDTSVDENRRASRGSTISVCVPCHVRAGMLTAALRSVIDQDVAGLIEVLVGDDSGGRLRATAEAVGDGRIAYTANSTRLGLAANHDALIARARGDYVALLHGDDVYLAGHLARAVRVLDASPDVGWVCSDVWVDHDGRRRHRGARIAEGRLVPALEQTVRHDYWLPSATVFRRAALSDARRLPDSACADVHLFVDLVAAGWAAWWDPARTVVYRQHADQVSRSGLHMRRGMVSVFEEYRFENAAAERARRIRLALALVSLGALHVRSGQGSAGRSALKRAARESPSTLLWKRRMLLVVSLTPYCARRLHSVWVWARRLRLKGRARRR